MPNHCEKITIRKKLVEPSRISVRSINSDFQGNIIIATPSTVYVPNNPREITVAALLNPRATGSIRSARRGVINDEAAFERVPLHFPSLERLTNFQRSFIFWFFLSKRSRSSGWVPTSLDHFINRIFNCSRFVSFIFNRTSFLTDFFNPCETPNRLYDN